MTTAALGVLDRRGYPARWREAGGDEGPWAGFLSIDSMWGLSGIAVRHPQKVCVLLVCAVWGWPFG